jgi:hypothetical protein
MGTCTTGGDLPAALAGASVEQIQNHQNHQNRTLREEKTAQKNSTPYNLNRAAPCPVTFTGICGHVAGITGHDQRNTQAKASITVFTADVATMLWQM